MFNKEKREQKKAEKLAKLEADIAKMEACQAEQNENMDDITRTYVRQWEEAEKLFKEFKVITFGNKKTLTGLISQANDSETLKCVNPGNIIIENRTSGDRTFFPGAWFISDERVCLYKHGMLGSESNSYDYPLETLQSVSAQGNGIAGGKIYLTTDTDLIT